ncbi:hypothetical protein PMIN06_011936 [Paraphaeosphaeria minitans]
MEPSQEGLEDYFGQQPGHLQIEYNAATNNNISGTGNPYVVFNDMVLSTTVELSDTQKAALKDHFNSTTWPKSFLSIENARDALVQMGRAWPAEDDAVLMSLPELLGIPILSEDAFSTIDNALFPSRFAWECMDRRTHLAIMEGDGVQVKPKFNGTATIQLEGLGFNGEGILDELIRIRGLLIARNGSLAELQEHSTRKDTGHKQMTTNDMLKARDEFNLNGWPGRFRDLQSFAASDAHSATTLSDAEADTLYAMTTSITGIAWDSLHAVFFPGVSDHDWKLKASNIYARRRWAAKDVDELKLAYEKDELEQFATNHGRSLGQVKRKAQSTFVREPNQSAGDTPSGSKWRVQSQKASYLVKPRQKRARTGDQLPLDAPTEEATADTLPQTTEEDAAYPATHQPGGIASYQSVVTDELIYNNEGYYPCDAYNIVRLRLRNLPFEAISQLAFKATYTTAQIRRIHDRIYPNLRGTILATPWPNFDKVFKENYARYLVYRGTGAAQRQPHLPRQEGTDRASTFLGSHATHRGMASLQGGQSGRDSLQLDVSHISGSASQKRDRSGGFIAGQTPSAPGHGTPMISSGALDLGSIYTNPQSFNSPSSSFQSAQMTGSQLPVSSQIGATLYDAFPKDYITQSSEPAHAFADPQLDQSTFADRSLFGAPQLSNQSLEDYMGAPGFSMPTNTDWSSTGLNPAPNTDGSLRQELTDFRNLAAMGTGAQPTSSAPTATPAFSQGPMNRGQFASANLPTWAYDMAPQPSDSENFSYISQGLAELVQSADARAVQPDSANNVEDEDPITYRY